MPQEGIFLMSQSREPSAGHFTLPPDFDKANLSANWVQKGTAVDMAKQPQPIVGTNYGADGWQVWQYPKDHRLQGRPCEITLKSGAYILMFRPKSVSEAVNAIYGNVSKQHLIREQAGEQIGGQLVTDAGILTDARIKEATGIKEFGGDDGLQIQMNQVRNTSRVEAAPAATAEL